MKLLKPTLRRLALAVGSLVITLALLEGAARILHLGSGGFWEPNPLFGWRNIPGAAGWESCYGECAVFVEINAIGLRDREITYEAPPNTLRVLVLGDSMTAGMQVPLASTFAKVLESELQATPGMQFTQVINAAVNGFGTDNELLYYRHEGYRFHADYVLLAVYLANDVYNNSRDLELSLGGSSHKPFFDLSPSGELELDNFPVQGTNSISVRFGSFLKRNFQLPRLVAETLRLRHQVPAILKPLVGLLSGDRGVQANEVAQGGGLGSGDICDGTYVPMIEHAWDITKAIVRQLNEEVRANGARLVVVSIPASAQTVPPQEGGEWYCERPDIELGTFLAGEGIPYLDLLYPFRQNALNNGPELYYSRDFHMDEAGHLLAGEELTEFMLQEVMDEAARGN